MREITIANGMSCGFLPSPILTPNRARARRRVVVCSAPSAAAAVARLRASIAEIAGPDRGIFGLEEEAREGLDALVRAAEAENPIAAPTADGAAAADGSWRLLYTDLTILGRKRVRLAIATDRKAGFVKLGEFVQVVDAARGQSKNVIEFRILTGGRGTFTIDANYEVVSEHRVAVTRTGAALQPESLDRLLGDNRSLLTQIFDPDGWLDITYVDEAVRIGRDHNGHVFVLEKLPPGE